MACTDPFQAITGRPCRRSRVHPRGSQGGAETTRAGDTALAEALKLQAGLKAQIWLEDGHVSSGLRAYSALA
jgi:hypothetical protein